MSKSRSTILICFLLAVLTFAAYWRVFGSGFVDYDDDDYVTENHWVQSGLTVRSVKWAFTTYEAANWHPLTWISHMTDISLYKMNPLGHHLTALILHVLSTILLYLLLQRMTGRAWVSAFVAALFAVHPLHVESVAWISERKDVLSTFFFMLTMHFYVTYTRRPSPGRYLLTLFSFTLGLLSKPMLVTLPIVLLLLDYWPLRRVRDAGRTLHDAGRPLKVTTDSISRSDMRKASPTALVVEKIPFFALSAASCVVTYLAQKQGGAVMAVQHASIGVRIANALVSYIAYLLKAVWPARLAVLYPHPFNSIPTWQVVGSVLLLAGITVLAVRARRKHPYLAVGWFWYLITLVPVIGLVQVGMQAMADRYTYVPLVGIFMAIAYGSVGVWGYGRKKSETPTLPHPHTPILASLVIAACAVGTWHQTGYWKDSETLFRHAIAVTGRNYVAQTGLGLALNRQGEFEEAIDHFRTSISIKPTPKAYDGMGAAFLRMDKLPEALQSYKKSLDLDPGSAKTHSNLGFILIDMGRLDDALGHFKESVKLDPDEVAPYCGMGIVYAQNGQLDDAVREYLRAIRLDPQCVQAYAELADIMARLGKTDKAIGYLETAVRISPDPKLHYRLGSMLAHQKEFDEAIDHYRSAIEMKPDYVEAHYDLAVALCAMGRFGDSIEHYESVLKVAPNYAKAHMSFALALYYKGDYARSRKEVELARKYGAQIDPEFIKALSEKSR